MIVSFIVALYFALIYDGEMADYMKLVVNIIITSVAWLAVTFMTPPTDKGKLAEFYRSIRPFSLGWQKVIREENLEESASKLHLEIAAMLLGCGLVYGLLFGMGLVIYGNVSSGLLSIAIALILAYLLHKLWPKVVTSD